MRILILLINFFQPSIYLNIGDYQDRDCTKSRSEQQKARFLWRCQTCVIWIMSHSFDALQKSYILPFREENCRSFCCYALLHLIPFEGSPWGITWKKLASDINQVAKILLYILCILSQYYFKIISGGKDIHDILSFIFRLKSRKIVEITTYNIFLRILHQNIPTNYTLNMSLLQNK